MSIKNQLLISLYSGFLTMIILAWIWGVSGSAATEGLISYKFRLQSNINNLIQIQNQLKEESYSYQSDRETLRLLARKIGFYKPNEVHLFIGQFSPLTETNAQFGEILSSPTQPENRKNLIAYAVLCVILSVWLLLFAYSFYSM